MKALSKFLIIALSIIALLMGLAGLFLSGIFSLSIPEAGVLGSILSILPVLSICVSILGFWAVIANSKPGQYTFAILMLTVWWVGTIIGAIIIGTLLINKEQEELSSVPE
ncbi:hypothetical protein [Photobacterium kishitanii]|uniref:Uncharacterized protein n=1 Tax=Photobacterium kishitanii TaxID=318456 RepID=A0A2T3KKE4_9GAMM|nr:hypothetical protein [Photobacterium kishitanii]PSU86695.1 hypothetical protein C0W42_19595 [Photobacterium kishitanii]PSU99984.1 hypothetical protein C9J27_06980 [Photobacterium kishitanii]PSW62669.1 hypothetical protein C0W54_03855 [Photobacterium kishitanii]